MNNEQNEQAEQLDLNIKLIMEDLLMRGQFAKTEMCKDDPMTDNPPLMMLAVESNELNPLHSDCVEHQLAYNLSKPLQVGIMPLINQDDVFDSFEEVIQALPVCPFEFLILSLEGYGDTLDDGVQINEKESFSDMKRGQLEHDFKTNPFSKVREALVVVAIDYNITNFWTVICPYVYDDNGVPVFDEPVCNIIEINDDVTEEHGKLFHSLVWACQYMNLAVKSKDILDLLKRAPKNGDK